MFLKISQLNGPLQKKSKSKYHLGCPDTLHFVPYTHNIDLDTVQHALVLLDLLFAIFCLLLNMAGVASWNWRWGWGGGVEGECMHTPIANGQSLLRLVFNSLSGACTCSVFVAKCFLPLLIQIVKTTYILFDHQKLTLDLAW